MATLHVTPTEVRVSFTRTEKILGLLRDFTFPRTAVSGVSVHDDGLSAVGGLRAPGLAVPGRRRIGTWRRRGTRVAVSAVAGMPTLRVELTGQRFDEVVLSGTDAAAWAATLQSTQ